MIRRPRGRRERIRSGGVSNLHISRRGRKRSEDRQHAIGWALGHLQLRNRRQAVLDRSARDALAAEVGDDQARGRSVSTRRRRRVNGVPVIGKRVRFVRGRFDRTIARLRPQCRFDVVQREGPLWRRALIGEAVEARHTRRLFAEHPVEDKRVGLVGVVPADLFGPAEIAPDVDRLKGTLNVARDDRALPPARLIVENGAGVKVHLLGQKGRRKRECVDTDGLFLEREIDRVDKVARIVVVLVLRDQRWCDHGRREPRVVGVRGERIIRIAPDYPMRRQAEKVDGVSAADRREILDARVDGVDAVTGRRAEPGLSKSVSICELTARSERPARIGFVDEKSDLMGVRGAQRLIEAVRRDGRAQPL